MKFKVFAVLFVFATPPVFPAVYKCMVNGQTVYSDKPCADPDQRESGRMDNKPALRIGAQNGSGGGYSTGAVAAPRPSGPIDFGDSPQGKLIKAKAIMESLEVDGRDCEWALKVDEKQLAKCITFMSQMQEEAEWGQTMAVIQYLLKDEAFFTEHRLEFSALKRLAERVAGYSQFAKVRLVGTQ